MGGLGIRGEVDGAWGRDDSWEVHSRGDPDTDGQGVGDDGWLESGLSTATHWGTWERHKG